MEDELTLKQKNIYVFGGYINDKCLESQNKLRVVKRTVMSGLKDSFTLNLLHFFKYKSIQTNILRYKIQ